MILKVIFANSVDPEQSDLGPYCLPVCKNRFEKSARIFSRQHKQTTFSDAIFLGALRVNIVEAKGNANANDAAIKGSLCGSCLLKLSGQ